MQRFVAARREDRIPSKLVLSRLHVIRWSANMDPCCRVCTPGTATRKSQLKPLSSGQKCDGDQQCLARPGDNCGTGNCLLAQGRAQQWPACDRPGREASAVRANYYVALAWNWSCAVRTEV